MSLIPKLDTQPATTPERSYNEEFDAYFNPITLEWLESACDDPECHYCANRPEKAPKLP
jgi:hypothetical protein